MDYHLDVILVWRRCQLHHVDGISALLDIPQSGQQGYRSVPGLLLEPFCPSACDVDIGGSHMHVEGLISVTAIVDVPSWPVLFTA